MFNGHRTCFILCKHMKQQTSTRTHNGETSATLCWLASGTAVYRRLLCWERQWANNVATALAASAAVPCCDQKGSFHTTWAHEAAKANLTLRPLAMQCNAGNQCCNVRNLEPQAWCNTLRNPLSPMLHESLQDKLAPTAEVKAIELLGILTAYCRSYRTLIRRLVASREILQA